MFHNGKFIEATEKENELRNSKILIEMHWKFKLTVPMDHISIYMCLYKCKINMNVFNIIYIKIAYPTITYVLKKRPCYFHSERLIFSVGPLLFLVLLITSQLRFKLSQTNGPINLKIISKKERTKTTLFYNKY